MDEKELDKIRGKLENCREYPAHVLKTKTYRYKKLKQKASNGYYIETDFILENVTAEIAWFESEGKFYRGYRLECDLQQYCDFRKQFTDDIHIWGNQVIAQEKNHLKSHVYHVRDHFESRREAEMDMKTYLEMGRFPEFLEDVLGEAG